VASAMDSKKGMGEKRIAHDGLSVLKKGGGKNNEGAKTEGVKK